MNGRAIRIDPTLPTPIWSQIEEAVRHLLSSGRLGPGDALPSVRDLARELRVNPNTIAKAYQRLGEGGFVAARRGEGTFVAQKPPRMASTERARVLAEGAGRLASLAVNLGATRAETVASLEAAWPEARTGQGGSR